MSGATLRGKHSTLSLPGLGARSGRRRSAVLASLGSAESILSVQSANPTDTVSDRCFSEHCPRAHHNV